MIEKIYLCPRCKGWLEQWRDRYECACCEAVYPIIVGIPDFRVYSDRYIDLEADLAKGRYPAAEAERRDFAGVAKNLLEHVPDAKGGLAELGRTRHAGSQVMGRTVHRYSLAPGPHVGVFEVGFLPRRFMNSYVRRIRGLAYRHIHLLSYF